MHEINVVYHSTEKFSWILGVSMYSLLKNNPSSHINFFIIENNISDSTKMIIKNYEKKCDCSVEFIKMPNIPITYNFKIKSIKENWLFDSFSRLFLGSLLPENIDKVLYLDSDIIINSNIDGLYDVELKNNLVAGVIDPLSFTYYKEFELDENDVYLQGGVLLFNLKLWRSEKMENKVADYMNQHNGYVFFMEQTVVSKLCQKRITVVDPKYNWTTINSEFNYKFIKRFRNPVTWYDKETYIASSENVAIIHYTSCFYVKNRPWNTGCNHKFQEVFLNYKHESPFSTTKLYDAKINKIKYLMIYLCPKYLLSIALKVVYNTLRVRRIKRQRISYEKDCN